MGRTLLEVKHLKKYFNVPAGVLHAVDDVSFTIEEGKTLGLVGESGCGKSTTGRAILRLIEPTSGEVIFNGIDVAKLNKKEITIELAEEALKDLISPNVAREVTPDLILQIVSDHLNIQSIDILGQKRNKEIAGARQIVMYLCRNMTSTPLQQIGQFLGGRDHTTVIHGIEKITKDLPKDPALQNTIDILKKKINPQ